MYKCPAFLTITRLVCTLVCTYKKFRGNQVSKITTNGLNSENTFTGYFKYIVVTMSMYNVYPIKRDFERGSGVENHEFYYFINYANDSCLFIIELCKFENLSCFDCFDSQF